MCTLTSFMIHDSLGFTKIRVDSIQLNSFMMSFQKGFNSRFTKAESSTEGSTHNSTHLWLPTPDSTQYNSTKNKIHSFVMCFQRDSTNDSRKQRAAEKVQLTIRLVYDNLHKIQFKKTRFRRKHKCYLSSNQQSYLEWGQQYLWAHTC